jgi:hypothetical protein
MRSYRKLSIATSIAVLSTLASSVAHAQLFTPGDLVVTRSVYQGTATTVTLGETLPPFCSAANCADGGAVANGTFPNVFQNDTVDSSFGVTSPIFIDDVNASGAVVTTLAVPTSLAVTSFSSKSEMGINLSTDGHYITFMGYVAPVNAIDVSNSNTDPNHCDSTNPVGSSSCTAYNFPRAVVQVDARGNVQVTAVDVYSGNNGRGAVFDTVNNQYLMVGNAGNGGSPEPTAIVANTGVQTVTPNAGPTATVIGVDSGVPGSTNGFQFGFNVTSLGDTADKSGKDDNFRGMALFNNTLYVTKGSGSNGINTVYQVGTAGTVPTAASGSTTQFTVLPGFSTTLAKATSGVRFPFGIWFANASTLYVADEGSGKAADVAGCTNANVGDAGVGVGTCNPNNGLGKWVLAAQADGGVAWQNVYTLQAGLNLGVQYSVSGLDPSLNPAPDGLRALSGKVNGDGTVTLYAVTSTISASGDQGADSNQLVAITDNLSFTTAAQAAGESFNVLQTAPFGQVLRGVSLAPTPVVPPPPTPAAPPVALGLLALLMLGAGGMVIRRNAGSSASA